MTQQVTSMEGFCIGIDPSQRSLGLAVVDANNAPIHIAAFRATGTSKHWTDYAITMAERVNWYIDVELGFLGKSLVLIEVPEQRGDSVGRGSRESEAIQKLYFMSGYLIALLHRNHEVCGLTPTMWKGRMPKKIASQRAKAICQRYGLNIDNWTTDCAEALLIARSRPHLKASHSVSEARSNQPATNRSSKTNNALRDCIPIMLTPSETIAIDIATWE